MSDDPLIHLCLTGGPEWVTACGKKVDPGTDQRWDVARDAVPADQWIGEFGFDRVTCPDCLEAVT